MRGRRLAGAGLAGAAIAATFALPMPTLGDVVAPPQPQIDKAAIVKARVPEPAAVAAARAALRKGLPQRFAHEGRAWKAERLPRGRALICEDARRCALVSRDSERILYIEHDNARARAAQAARKGEPR